MTKIVFVILIIIFGKGFAQESPKNIISDENKNILPQEEAISDKQKSETKRYNALNSEKPENSLEDINPLKQEERGILIEDLPNKYNRWHGTLSSDSGGLGWMMWQNTRFILSKKLIDQIAPSEYSPTLNKLLKNFLLSRAKGPKIASEEEAELVSNSYNNDVFPFLEKRINYLINTGF